MFSDNPEKKLCFICFSSHLKLCASMLHMLELTFAIMSKLSNVLNLSKSASRICLRR